MNNLKFNEFTLKINRVKSSYPHENNLNTFNNKLKQIYKLLGDIDKSLISIQISNAKNAISKDYQIHLNENLEFKCLRKDKLKIRNFPDAYYQLTNFIDINIKNFLIYSEFN